MSEHSEQPYSLSGELLHRIGDAEDFPAVYEALDAVSSPVIDLLAITAQSRLLPDPPTVLVSNSDDFEAIDCYRKPFPQRPTAKAVISVPEAWSQLIQANPYNALARLIEVTSRALDYAELIENPLGRMVRTDFIPNSLLVMVTNRAQAVTAEFLKAIRDIDQTFTPDSDLLDCMVAYPGGVKSLVQNQGFGEKFDRGWDKGKFYKMFPKAPTRLTEFWRQFKRK